MGAAAISGILIAGLGMLLSSVAGIWLLVIAFTVHWGCGLACLFVPFASLVFLIMCTGQTHGNPLSRMSVACSCSLREAVCS